MTELERQLSDMMHRHAERLDRRPFATLKLVRRARRRRAATAAVTGVAVVALALGGVTLIPKLASNVAPANHSPRDNVGPNLLPPLCGTGSLLHPPCPTETPPGDYRSSLWGLSTEWPFRFTLPSGWRVEVLPAGGGLDLIQSARSGVSLVVYPHPIDGKHRENQLGSERLARWVSGHPKLEASPPTHTTFAGMRAWQVDVHVRNGASTARHCRIGERGSSEWLKSQPSARCVPLFRDYLERSGDQPLVAPLSGTDARLIFFKGRRGVPAVLWVWNLGQAGTGFGDLGPVRQVLESFRFGPQSKASP